MTGMISQIRARKALSVRAQCIAAALAVVVAVALPQIFHIIGDFTGVGKSLGVAFLPMHLPIIFVGLIAGPIAGASAGLLSPVASMLLSGMPVMARLPLMMAELFAYGLVAGALRRTSMPTIVKILITQISGRIVYMGATALAIYAFSRSDLGIISGLEGLKAGMFGIILQCTLLPLLIYRIENIKNKTDL